MPRPTKISRKEPLKPGDVLYHLYMLPKNITQTDISKGSGISKVTINYIMQGRARITPRIALGLSKFFKNDKFYWMKIQNEYDFWELEREE